jgi:hypothetical protein
MAIRTNAPLIGFPVSSASTWPETVKGLTRSFFESWFKDKAVGIAKATISSIGITKGRQLSFPSFVESLQSKRRMRSNKFPPLAAMTNAGWLAQISSIVVKAIAYLVL